MRLQEHIRKVLKEETNKFELVKNFIYTMYDNVRFIEYVDERNEIMVYYKDNPFLIPTEICEMVTNYIGLNVVPWYEYDENRIGKEPDFYLDTEEYEEELNESTFFRRRVDMRLMEKEFFETLNFATDMFFKRRYAGIDFTFKDFKERVIDYLMDGYHSELSDGGLNDFPYDEVYEFLSNHFHDKIKDRYNSLFDQETTEEEELTEKWSEKYKKSINCNNPKGFSQRAHCQGKRKQSEMKEGELTERCWKGYTQKGMKTMFGKRYPNCVKKTK
jgi:hypothetical protein